MCGRYTLRANLNRILAEFEAEARPEYQPVARYNVAPTQMVSAIRQAEDGHRELLPLKWGLIPSWAKDEKIAYSTINARAETVAEKPAFRSAFKRRRCLIVADGYYEWQAVGGTEKKPIKQPHLIQLKDGRPFGMAGLWEKWGKDDDAIESCTIIVTAANAKLAKIHDRMPVIIPHDEYAAWLDPEFQGIDELKGMLRQWPGKDMETVAVSTLVNSPKNEKPECVEPLAA